jgi:glycosyltransferase involved in cell wall biosynthesis
VVDDGSTDNTKEVIREFQKRDKRIRYIKHERNKGYPQALNTGIMAARGEHIAFQDDDEWLPEKLEKQIRVVETAPLKVGVVYTGFYRLENNKQTYIPSSKITQKEGDIFKSLLKGNFVAT